MPPHPSTRGASPHPRPFVTANSARPSLEPIGNLGANVWNSNLTLDAVNHEECWVRDVTLRIR
jgi:hypothetical protein